MLKIFNKYFLYYPVVSIKAESFFRASRELEVSQNIQFQKIQFERFRKLFISARHNVPYYSEVFKNIDPASICSLKDICRLPTLDKSRLKEQQKNLLSKQNYPLLTKKTTGGSTGQPVTIFKSRTAMGYELAATWRGYSWAGISIGDKQARFWGVPMTQTGRLTARLTDFVCNRKRLSAFSFNDQTLAHYTKKLNIFKPDFFYGYVSMLCEYADYVLQNNIKLKFHPKAIITTSEVLYPEHREKLNKAFGCGLIRNEYGCGEVGSVAHECENGNMHISAENMIVEILKGETPCSDGEIGEVVVTELRNHAMPLIRYRLGDFARLSTQPCSCGRTLPVMQEIKGRAYDTIVFADGRKFHGEYFMYVMEGAERENLGVSRFQIIQKSMTDIVVKIVPRENYSKEESGTYIVDGIMKQLDKKVNVTIELVDNIYREKSGKMRLIVGLENYEQ